MVVNVPRENDRRFAHKLEDVLIVTKNKFPANGHVLSIVSSEGDIMSSQFYQKGGNATKEVYVRVLQTVAETWIDIVSPEGHGSFNKTGYSRSTACLLQNLLSGVV